MAALLCYISETGEDEVLRWYLAQSAGVRAAVFATIETLRNRPMSRCRRKPFAMLRGAACAGLGEIRIEEPRLIHRRILGCRLADEDAFVMLFAFAKDDDPEYRRACAEAQKRKVRIDGNKHHVREWRFPTVGGVGGGVR